ncbi:DNA-binding transcriptional regulator, MerR family [Sphingomonas sp. OK281]|nr:DNA-binding transcriptional regulator, MerR family [Sphingomonas sp. OK281]
MPTDPDMPAPADDGVHSVAVTDSPARIGAIGKTDTAFRTIGEVSAETGLPQHILRYWETRFPQLRPLQRAGNRRYYRGEDVALVRRIDILLNRDGYTVRGVQQLLAAEKPTPATASTEPAPMPAPPVPEANPQMVALKAIRALLAQALIEDVA